MAGATDGKSKKYTGQIVKSRTADYDPNLTTRGTLRQVYRAPSKAQKRKREMLAKDPNWKPKKPGMKKGQHIKSVAERVAKHGMSGKLHEFRELESGQAKRVHLWMSIEQVEWLDSKAFREGVNRSEWMRRIIDAIRMAELGLTMPGGGQDGEE